MIKKILTGALAALTIGGSLAASTVPAAAAPNHGGDRGGYRGGHDRGYHGGYRGGGYRYGWGGPAAAGLIGLAAGAALAGAYDGGGYYAPGYAYAPCRVEMRWNPYWGGYERVRVCY